MKEIKGLMARYVQRDEEPEDDDNMDITDISSMLKAELADEKKKPDGIGSFVSTGSRGNLFYRIPDKEHYPASVVVARIVEGLKKSGLAETRFVYKMQPIFLTVAAHPEAIERELGKEITQYVEGVPNTPTTLVKWSLVWNKKSNSDAALDRVILANKLHPLFASSRFIVDLKRPQTAVLVSIFKTVACLGLATDFQIHCEYNIHKITRKDGEGIKNAESSTPAPKETVPEEGADETKAETTTETEPEAIKETPEGDTPKEE